MRGIKMNSRNMGGPDEEDKQTPKYSYCLEKRKRAMKKRCEGDSESICDPWKRAH